MTTTPPPYDGTGRDDATHTGGYGSDPNTYGTQPAYGAHPGYGVQPGYGAQPERTATRPGV